LQTLYFIAGVLILTSLVVGHFQQILVSSLLRVDPE
jgi:hypothetical protein